MKSLFNRSTFNNALALGGVVIILLQTLMIAYTRVEVSVILAGIMINQIGVWRLAERLMPERRVYLQLRAEVDRFIGLVRTLNKSAVEGDDSGVDATQAEMQESISRMVDVAAVRTEGGE